jgi:hypothetical protein
MLVIDETDAALAPEIERLGIKAPRAPIIMTTLEDKCALAQKIVELAAQFRA